MKKGNELTPETIMETGKQLRESLLAVLTPEERLAGLTAEELVTLVAQIETYLREQGKSQSSQTKPETN